MSDINRPLNASPTVPSYEALLKAVSMMGFSPQKLADFVSGDMDHVCKAILLGSLDLSEEKLRAVGASSPEKWRAALVELQYPQR